MVGRLYVDLRRRLTDAGCSFVRYGKGSHEIWFSPLTPCHVAVQDQENDNCNGILKEAGLNKVY